MQPPPVPAAAARSRSSWALWIIAIVLVVIFVEVNVFAFRAWTSWRQIGAKTREQVKQVQARNRALEAEIEAMESKTRKGSAAGR